MEATVAAEAIAQVEAAMGELRDVLSADRPDALGEVLAAMPGLRSQLESIACSAIEMSERSTLLPGRKRVTQYVADRTGADPKAIRADLRLGRFLADFAVLADGFASGQLLREHVEFIRRTVHSSRTHFALTRDQADFVTWAADLDFTDFVACCRYWMIAADPDGAEPREQVAKNYLRARKQGDGTVKITGHLDPLAGHAFLTAFEREQQALYRESTDVCSVDGDLQDSRRAQLAPDLMTSRGQRAVTAFMNLIRRGAARTEATDGTPLINIVMSQTVAEDLLRRLDGADFGPLAVNFNEIDGRCETIAGTPLHPRMALAAMGRAQFRRQIMDANKRVIDVSTNTRCFTPWQKQALLVAARGRCSTAGCDAAHAWLEADHIQPHSKGGPTRLDNGQVLCSAHNKAKADSVAGRTARRARTKDPALL